MTTTTRLWISSCAVLAVLGAARPADAGNPYSFFGSVAECAAAERDRCTACLADNACAAITRGADGNAECRQLGDGGGRGHYLMCINLSLAIDAVASCVGASAPGCGANTRASESLATLDVNAAFLDNPACSAPLDICLAGVYGPSTGQFPGPGSGGTTSPPPRHTSIDCGDSCNGDANCDEAPDCELDGPSCDGESDTSCSDSGDDGGGGCTDDAGDDGGCSGDSEDACGADDSSSCDSSDCGGGGDSDCGGGGGGGDCSSSGGGGDCSSGGGGDCSGGGGGDCGGGGGGDCNVTSRHGRAVASLPVAVGWALLPIPFAALARRRARRRHARQAASPGGADREAAS